MRFCKFLDVRFEELKKVTDDLGSRTLQVTAHFTTSSVRRLKHRIQ